MAAMTAGHHLSDDARLAMLASAEENSIVAPFHWPSLSRLGPQNQGQLGRRRFCPASSGRRKVDKNLPGKNEQRKKGDREYHRARPHQACTGDMDDRMRDTRPKEDRRA